MLRAAGFESVCIEQKAASRAFIKEWLPGSGAEDYVVSAYVTATKPASCATGCHSHQESHDHVHDHAHADAAGPSAHCGDSSCCDKKAATDVDAMPERMKRARRQHEHDHAAAAAAPPAPPSNC